jgi:hypothetical protein
MSRSQLGLGLIFLFSDVSYGARGFRGHGIGDFVSSGSLGFFLGYVRASRRFGLRRRFFDHSNRRIHTVDARASRHRAPTLNRTRSQSTS